MKFNVGDMVIYNAKHPLHKTPEFENCIGEITKASKSEDGDTYRVRFIPALSNASTINMIKGNGDDWGCCVENLTKIKIDLPPQE